MAATIKNIIVVGASYVGRVGLHLATFGLRTMLIEWLRRAQHSSWHRVYQLLTE
jgi:hypothetical protein